MDSMINMKNFSTISIHERAKIVSQLTCLSSLLYHIGVFILFFFLEIYPMFFFNIASIILFSVVLFFIPKLNSYVGAYLTAAIEVVIHQLLADYFLGTGASFHYFILLIGLLPFLVFEGKFKIAIPVTSITCVLFVVLENITIVPVYEINPTILYVIKYVNVALTILNIVFVVLVYTLFEYLLEKRLSKQNSNLGRELKLASTIQQNFFAHKLEKFDDWDIGYVNQPMANVSGDLYDFYATGKNLDGFGVFDVSGHGISSGLVTMLVKNIIHQEFYKEEKMELWETLLAINDRIIEEKGDIENYLTGILARIYGNEIEFVNASHPCPIVYRRSTDTIEIIERKSESLGAIGIRDFPTFYESQFLTLEKGDEILLYTDGVVDCQNSENVQFGIERLKQSLENVVGLEASQQTYLILNDINDFRGSREPNDDITIVILKK